MKYVVYAIKDRATDSFSNPQFTSHIGAAVRGFSDAINNKESPVAKHPEDFDLYELGGYDDRTGLFETGVPRQVAVGKDLVRS